MTADDGVSGAQAASRILLAREEVDLAAREATARGLVSASMDVKAWDNVLALDVLRGLEDEPILDLGCRFGTLLTWLDQLGYRRLYGCDTGRPWPAFRNRMRHRDYAHVIAGLWMLLRHNRRLRRAPIEQTGYRSGFFAAATCMSVVEHGVDLPAFFREAHRILRAGAPLVVSTDFWPERVTGGREMPAYEGGADVVFDRDGLLALGEQARQAGFEVPEIATEAKDKVVSWAGRDYTFAFLVFRKPA